MYKSLRDSDAHAREMTASSESQARADNNTISQMAAELITSTNLN